MKISTLASACLLATLAAGTHAQAQARLDLYPTPNNYVMLGLSAGGNSGVSYNGSALTDVWLPTSPGNFVAIGGNSPANFAGALGITANGATISGAAQAPNGYSQAATYNTATGAWTTLGSLGFNATAVVQGQQQQSASTAISSDGSTVGGLAYFNTSGTTGSITHATVFKNGSVTDLNPTGTTSGRVMAMNHDGSVIVGTNNTQLNSGVLWKWNGSAYVASSPTMNNTAGTATAIQLNVLSDNGVWAAGGSVNGLSVQYGTISQPRVFSQATLWNTATNSGLLIPFDHVIDTAAGSTDVDRNMKAAVTGVSNGGLVIGLFNINVGGTTGVLQTDTWIYDAATGVTQTFDSFLAGQGLGLGATQHVWNLGAMSADGSAMSGLIFDSATGQSTGFVLHTAAVPEPATYALFGLGLLAIGARRLRRTLARAA